MNNDTSFLRTYDTFLFGNATGVEANEALWKLSEPLISDILDDFYQHVMQVDELRAIIGDPSRTGKLKNAQYNHWRNLLSGRLDENYMASAVKIGAVHERIGLDQGWYLASYAWVLMRLLPQVAAKTRFRGRGMQSVLSQLIARLFIDIMVSTSAYEDKTLNTAINLNTRASDTSSLRSLADTVASVNSTAFYLAKLTRNSRQARMSSQTISSAASELVASVEQIAENSESAATEAGQSNDSVQQGHQAIREVTGAIEKMMSAVNETSEGITELSEASSQIGQILTVIEDIADQTNLLALNATIEAARAGEAGKGFAIVASEVKNLASQTSKSTEDITRRIEALTNGMEKIRRTMTNSQSAVGEGEDAVATATQTMDRISSQVSGVSEKMQDISNILQQQKLATSEIAESISSVADISAENEDMVGVMSEEFQKSNVEFVQNAKNWFHEGSDQALCEMAKIDHVLFKKRIIDTVMERGNWRSQEVPDHHACRLGKWYDSLTIPSIVNHPAYNSLTEPHKRVHEAGKKALEYHANGNLDDAISQIEKMNEASNDVTRLLAELSLSMDQAIQEQNRRQFERLTTRMNAQLDGSSGSRQNITIEDISEGGARISGAHLQKGEEITLSVGNDGPKTGVARWTKGDQAGIQFKQRSKMSKAG